MTETIFDRLFSGFLLLLILLEETAYPLWAITAALIHEAGHIAAAFFLRIPIQKIHVGLTGIHMNLAFFKGTSYPAELLTAIAGPACNFLCAAGVFTAVHFSVLTASPPIFFFAACNLFYAVFNLFPVDSLDGGSMIRSICGMMDSPDTGEKILKVGEVVSAFFLWILAIYAQLMLNGNFSVLILSLFFLFKVIFKKNAVTIL